MSNMHNKQLLFFTTIITILFISISCSRDYSYEKSFTQKIQEKQAKGFLGNNSGQCVTANINGEYLTNVATDASNTVQITVTITEPGKYSINTETVNGIFFNASGIFYNAGTYNVTLQGHGTAINIGNTSFTVKFNQSQCAFTLPVLTDLNTWSFWDNNKKYSGKTTFLEVAPVFDRLGSTRQTLVFQGDNILSSAPLYLLFYLNSEVGASFLQPSTHYIDSDDGGFTFFEDNLQKYTLNQAISRNSFLLRIISFNRATSIMEGSFEGPIFNLQNSRFNITKGRFKANARVTVP